MSTIVACGAHSWVAELTQGMGFKLGSDRFDRLGAKALNPRPQR